MLFVGRVLAGISGGSFATCSAYIADISTEENRAKNFGLIGIAFGVGFTLGPVIGGFLGEFGPRVPFLGAAALSLRQFHRRLLPAAGNAGGEEPPQVRMEARQSARRADADAPLSRHRLGQPRHVPVLPGACRLSLGLVVRLDLSLRLERGADRPVARHLRHRGAVVMGLVLPRIVPVLGEWKTALLGLCFSAVGLTGYAFAWEGWVVYVVIVATVMENVADPPLRSIAAGKVPPSAQGELQGALTSLSSITTIIGPLIFTQMFGYFTRPEAPITFAGAPYLAAALFILVAPAYS